MAVCFSWKRCGILVIQHLEDPSLNGSQCVTEGYKQEKDILKLYFHVIFLVSSVLKSLRMINPIRLRNK